MLNFSLVVLLPISLTISQVIPFPLLLRIDSKHSIFSASIVDRQAFASKGWILDTGATDHIIHSIPYIITITFVINAVAHLPVLETALVTHIGTVKLSETLILTGVLCVHCFSFQLDFH